MVQWIEEDSLPDENILELCQAIKDRYGHEFHQYSSTSLKRRIGLAMMKLGHHKLDIFAQQILAEPIAFEVLLQQLSVNVTSMFRDPNVYQVLRQKVLPVLASFPHIRIWSAGTATGEEAYSLAILLQEEGLYRRSLIYATDMNPYAIKRAFVGRYSLEKMAEYSSNYNDAGGTHSLSRYYSTSSNMAHMRPGLLDNVIFSTHNLVTDGAFNEFHLILCRNVLIYFNEQLAARVIRLFGESLVGGGLLCLGTQESLFYESRSYSTFCHNSRIFKRL